MVITLGLSHSVETPCIMGISLVLVRYRGLDPNLFSTLSAEVQLVVDGALNHCGFLPITIRPGILILLDNFTGCVYCKNIPGPPDFAGSILTH